TAGIIRILGVGNVPVPVDDAEIMALQTIVANKQARIYPRPGLEVGSKVRITMGPLRGVVGVLRAIKNTHVLIVSVDLLRRSVVVEIEAEWIALFAGVEGGVMAQASHL